MSAILSIDIMAQRYGCLPSQLLDQATTFDLFICNSAIRYQQIKENESQGRFDHYSVEDLQAIKDSV